jgi:tetratricopeptide (TPR) repeat protein
MELSAPPGPAGASLVDRGRAAFAAGELGRAAEFFRRAAAEAADDPQAPFLLVQTLMALGKYTVAAEVARAAVERFPGWPSLTFRPIDLYGPDAAEYRNHLRLLSQTQAAHPDDPVLQFLYGHALWFDGQKDEARIQFRRAAPACPAAERFLRPTPPAVL